MSEKQIEANRLNSQKSTGPRTDAGKAVSAQNALQSGLYAQSLIIRGEKVEDYQSLINDYHTMYQPSTPLERDLADLIARNVWELRRLARVEAERFEHGLRTLLQDHPGCEVGYAYKFEDERLARLQRTMNGVQKSLKDAVREMERVQKLRKEAPDHPQPIETKPEPVENGFVPSTVSEAPAAAPQVAEKPAASASSPVVTTQNTPAAPKIVAISTPKEPKLIS